VPYIKYNELLQGHIDEASVELQKSEHASQQLYVDYIRLFCGVNG
jgi:hypothetical protein